MNIPELLKSRADKYDRISLLFGLASTCTSAWTENVFWANSPQTERSGSRCQSQMFAHTKVGLLGTAFYQTSLKDPNISVSTPMSPSLPSCMAIAETSWGHEDAKNATRAARLGLTSHSGLQARFPSEKPDTP